MAGNATPRPAAEAESQEPRGSWPQWKLSGYPDEPTFTRIVETYPDVAYNADTNSFVHFLALPPWIRLGWPSLETWSRCKGLPIARQAYADLAKGYATREEFEKVMRYWPDAVGQPMVDVELSVVSGITINDLTYGPGRHRVPRDVATVLREIDNKARAEWINQFIPKDHQDKVVYLGGSGMSEGAIG